MVILQVIFILYNLIFNFAYQHKLLNMEFNKIIPIVIIYILFI